ncbi:hypothetical protein [Granulicella sibirica]|uniref:Uncharacterized protein n=1 Tax=Granulicella sibirica TaxID=2479048 RepID=A0A4Q0T2J2_9BACT|nr:hypothetical protein [Granulicella sibirica]RXH56228.1 hypothetical protein GRAN_3085 [Granulicella sibirica]
MPFPAQPVPFAPRQATNFFSGQGAFFLVDPARLEEIAPNAGGTDLLKALTTTRLGPTLYEAGVVVPALGVEPGFYTVDVRSTVTEDSPLPLTHIVYSTGFVLGTETGELMLCNTDRLQQWNPGAIPSTRVALPITGFERTIQISPGWYAVTVVVGLRDVEVETFEQPSQERDDEYNFNQDPDQAQTPRARRQQSDRSTRKAEPTEQWVCSFLLDPEPVKPTFAADLKKTLSVTGS